MSDKEIVRKVQNNKIKIACSIIALLLAMVLGGAIAMWLQPKDEIKTDQIREEVEPVLMAVSYKYNFTEVLHHSDSMEVGIPVLKGLLENNFVATIKGTAFIGIDMEKDASAVSFETKTDPEGNLTEVRVVLPKSEVFAVEINEDSLTIYEDRGGLIPVVNDITKEDVHELRVNAQEQQRKQVIDNGLLELSDERIRSIVTAQIQSIHGDNVKVTVDFVEKADAEE